MGRGNHRESIFEDKMDYEFFELLLSDIKRRFPYELHSFCLMTNHYHLLLETNDKEIWHIMKRLQQVYTEYYNSKYHLVGHLFQGRYKACLVKDDAYFLQTSRYIHMNPVKAKIASHPEDYQWSSYRTLIGMNDLKFVNCNTTWSYFKSPQNTAYRLFVEESSVTVAHMNLQFGKRWERMSYGYRGEEFCNTRN